MKRLKSGEVSRKFFCFSVMSELAKAFVTEFEFFVKSLLIFSIVF